MMRQSASMLLAAFGVSLMFSSAAFGSFGVQTSGPNAFSVVVSNSAEPNNPEVANPNDLDTQAGSHPFDMTTSFLLNTDSEGELSSELFAKHSSVMLPAGFAGSITSVPQCPMSDLATRGVQFYPG